jgi:hypothetical protein
MAKLTIKDTWCVHHPLSSGTVQVVSLEAAREYVERAVVQEREACALLCDEFGEEWMCDSQELAKLIRARNTQ